MSSTRPPADVQAWVDARKRHRLSHAQVQMARELGMNPRKLGGIDNHRQEPWKAPLPEFIQHLYRKRFGRDTGLGTLSGALKAFADFLRLDPDLVRVAAQHSPSMAAGPDEGALPGWIAALPEAEKTELLVRVAGAAPVAVRGELLRRFRMANRTDAAPEDGVRTVGELLEAADRIAEERSRIEAERTARENERRAREAAAARALHLDRLAPREEETWGEVDALIASKQPKSYDQAVSLLRDLRDLAARDGREPAFAARLQALREAHAKKPSFLDRLRQALR